MTEATWESREVTEQRRKGAEARNRFMAEANEAMFDEAGVALPSIRRVMRPGARFGATVWGPVAHNPFHGAVLDAVRAEGGWGDAKLEVVQAFSRGDRAAYEGAFTKAGFRDVRVRVVSAVRRFASFAAARASVEESPIRTAPLARLDGARHASAWKRVEKLFAAHERDGALEIPAEWLIVGATK
jgi:hypothetical protein